MRTYKIIDCKPASIPAPPTTALEKETAFIQISGAPFLALTNPNATSSLFFVVLHIPMNHLVPVPTLPPDPDDLYTPPQHLRVGQMARLVWSVMRLASTNTDWAWCTVCCKWYRVCSRIHNPPVSSIHNKFCFNFLPGLTILVPFFS